MTARAWMAAPHAHRPSSTGPDQAQRRLTPSPEKFQAKQGLKAHTPGVQPGRIGSDTSIRASNNDASTALVRRRDQQARHGRTECEVSPDLRVDVRPPGTAPVARRSDGANFSVTGAVSLRRGANSGLRVPIPRRQGNDLSVSRDRSGSPCPDKSIYQRHAWQHDQLRTLLERGGPTGDTGRHEHASSAGGDRYLSGMTPDVTSGKVRFDHRHRPMSRYFRAFSLLWAVSAWTRSKSRSSPKAVNTGAELRLPGLVSSEETGGGD
jgi:hypothetical protein